MLRVLGAHYSGALESFQLIYSRAYFFFDFIRALPVGSEYFHSWVLCGRKYLAEDKISALEFTTPDLHIEVSDNFVLVHLELYL